MKEEERESKSGRKCVCVKEMEERHSERDREKKDKRETAPPNRRLRGRLCLHFISNDKIPNGFRIYIYTYES